MSATTQPLTGTHLEQGCPEHDHAAPERKAPYELQLPTPHARVPPTVVANPQPLDQCTIATWSTFVYIVLHQQIRIFSCFD